MSKLGKFLRRPIRFFADAAANRRIRAAWTRGNSQLGPDAPTAILVGFARWKTFIPDFLPGHKIVVLSHNQRLPANAFETILRHPRPHIFAWSYKFPEPLREFCSRNGIALTFVEDGFIRSVGLGADRTRPASLVFDDKAMHFDRQNPSQLEILLSTYDFAADDRLMAQAAILRDLLTKNGVSKYMFAQRRSVREIIQPQRRVVLVLGQVEDDLSIRYGAERVISGNDMVKLAAQENPGALILYRPHPEALAYAKPHYSRPQDVAGIATILGPEFAIGDCLDNADLVYTVTSLAGFEAALRGKQVVTLGAPFYSGWGFTQDRLAMPRRRRRLTALEVLAAAYLLYPRYDGIREEGSAAAPQIVAMVKRLAASSNPGDGPQDRREG